MSTIITDRRAYSNDYVKKGVWDQSPKHITSSAGSALNYVERGENIPGWRQRKAAGLGVTTGLTGVNTFLKKRKALSYHQTGIGSWKGYDAFLAGFHALPSVPWGQNVSANWSITAKALNDAAMDIHEQIMGARTTFNSLAFIGELHEVIQLFRKPVETLFGETMHFGREVVKLKAKYKDVKHLSAQVVQRDYAGQLSDAYLKYKFAVAPLGQDLGEYAIAVDKLSNELGSRTSVRLDARAQAFEPVDETVYGIPDATYATQRIFRTKVADVRLHGSYRPRSDLSAFSRFGFNLPDLVITAWELLPWSFILEYFSNVADVLRAQVQSNADVAWLELGTKQMFEVEGAPVRAFVPGADASSFVATASGGAYRAQRVGVNRRSTTIPGVSFAFASPPSTGKLLNVAALATLAARGKPNWNVSAG